MSNRRLGAVAILSAAWLMAAPPTFAQEPQPEAQPPGEVVVTGTPRDEQIRDFVRSLTPTVGNGSIPRFIDHVCPVAVGLVAAQNARVAGRLREVAEAIGLNVGGRGCAPNAFVVVTRDKRAFIEALAQQRPASFGDLTPRQIRRLARSPGPAAAWQLAGPVNENDTPLRYDDRLGAYVNDTTVAASRLRSPSRIGFDASVVVVELSALEGLTPTQVADYAAMRLFARLDPARLPAPPPPTILTILEAPMGSAVPITLTEWDFAFLRGLYSASRDLNATGQRSQIGRQLAEDLSQPEQ
jgi:hypothetical protein